MTPFDEDHLVEVGLLKDEYSKLAVQPLSDRNQDQETKLAYLEGRQPYCVYCEHLLEEVQRRELRARYTPCRRRMPVNQKPSLVIIIYELKIIIAFGFDDHDTRCLSPVNSPRTYKLASRGQFRWEVSYFGPKFGKRLRQAASLT